MRPTSPAADRSARSPAAQGFALLEVVLALALMGLAAALALPNALAARAQRGDLWQAAGSICALLKLDRNAALASRTSVRTVLDMREQTVVSGASGRSVKLKGGLRFAADLERTGAGRGDLVFAPDGTATGARVGLWSGDAAILITVNGITGAVTMAKMQ